jgi:HSP20 family molecular chaperone IbpA
LRLRDETVFWSPSIDVYRLDDRWVVYAELPGVDRDDLEVVVGPDYVRISGRKKLPMQGISPRSLEIDTGRFKRTIELQGRVDTSRSTARLSDGLLRVEAVALDSGRVSIPITEPPAQEPKAPGVVGGRESDIAESASSEDIDE